MCRYIVRDRFSKEFIAFDVIGGRSTESSRISTLQIKMKKTEAEDFHYMESSGITELNNGSTMLIIEG